VQAPLRHLGHRATAFAVRFALAITTAILTARS
jgi:hypothetical protein